MSISLLLYVNGVGVEIDVHQDFYEKYKNLNGEAVHTTTPEKIKKQNQKFISELNRVKGVEDRSGTTKRIVNRLLSD